MLDRDRQSRHGGDRAAEVTKWAHAMHFYACNAEAFLVDESLDDPASVGHSQSLEGVAAARRELTVLGSANSAT